MTKKLNILSSFSVAVLLGAFIQGCSGVSKNQCMESNWKNKGIEDGKKGLAAEQILETQKVCSKKGMDFPITEYKEGWEQGIADYCAPQNGFNMASKGKDMKVENCPIQFRPALAKNIDLGKKFADAESKIEKLQNESKSLKGDKKDIKQKISDVERELSDLKAQKESLSESKISNKDNLDKNSKKK